MGVLTTVFSLIESVGIGLLPPSILFAHSTFLCWYAMSNHPDPTCNPWAGDDALSAKGKTVGLVISLSLLLSTVAWITWHGEKVRACVRQQYLSSVCRVPGSFFLSKHNCCLHAIREIAPPARLPTLCGVSRGSPRVPP